MVSYNIVFKPSVEKDLRSLPKTRALRYFRGKELVSGNGNLVLSYPKESEEKRLLDTMLLAMPK